MRIIKFVMLGSILAATPAMADNTATSNVGVSGTIVAALSISSTAGIAMPAAAKPTSGNGTVTMDCSAATAVGGAGSNVTITYTATINPFAKGQASATGMQGGSNANQSISGGLGLTGQCGTVQVSGEPNFYFLTSVGAPTGVTSGFTVLGNCTSASKQLSGAGAATVYCGATVTIPANTSATTYAATIPVTVTYD